MSLISVGAGGYLPTPPIPISPIVNNVHPRLLVVPDGYSLAPTLSELKTRLDSGGPYATEFANWATAINAQYITQTWLNSDSALAFAFMYLVHGIANTGSHSQAQYGAKARQALLNYASNGVSGDSWYSQPSGGLGGPAAMSYDWLQANGDGILSSGDKATLTGYLADMSQQGQSSAFCSPSGTPLPIYFNSGAYYQWSRLIGALAAHGNGSNDAWCDLILTNYQANFRDDAATSNLQRGFTWIGSEFTGNQGSGWHQGQDYWMAYTAPWLIQVEESFRTAYAITKATYWGTDQTDCLKYFPRNVLWMYCNNAFPRTFNAAFPDNYAWVFAKMNGAFGTYPTIPDGQYPQARALLNACTGVFDSDSSLASLSRWLLLHRTGQLETVGMGSAQSTRMILFRWLMANPSPPAAQSPSALGYAIAQEHPVKRWTMRTSWDTTINEPFVAINSAQKLAPGSFGGQYNLNGLGDFSIWYNGAVVVNGGLGLHSLGSGGTQMGSTMMFPDRSASWQSQTLDANIYGPSGSYIWASSPLGTNTGGTNLGSSRWYFNGTGNFTVDSASGAILDSSGETRFLPGTGGSADCNYVFCNLTRGYDYNDGSFTQYDPGGPRISSYVRQFVYFLPSNPTVDSVRVVVFDRSIVLDTKFEHNWRVWTTGEPSFSNGSPVAGPSRGPTGTSNKTHSTTTTLLTAENTTANTNNKFFFTPLLPASRDVIKIGIAPPVGTANWTYENILGVTATEGPNEGDRETQSAAWRIEVVPSTPALSMTHLHVIEVTPSSLGSQSTTAVISGSTWTGARVGNRVAVFPTDSYSKSSGTFTIPASFSGKVIVSALASGSRSIDPDANGNINSLGSGVVYTATPGSDQTLYFNLVVGGSPCVITVS